MEKKAVEEGMRDPADQRRGASLAYTFDRQPPHRLLRFERDDGTVYQMAKCERLAYWEMHDPGDEAWLPEGRTAVRLIRTPGTPR